MKKLIFACVALVAILITGCTQRPITYTDDNGFHVCPDPLEKCKADDEKQAEMDEDDPENHDPLEPTNRFFFGLNRVLDNFILKPIAILYEGLVPTPIQKGVSNFVTNFFAPVTAANHAMQGNSDGFAKTTWRFMLNTTVGLLGIFDVASALDVEDQPTNFNETLASWGVNQGGYLMLPLLGPSSMRNATGSLVDFLMNPFRILADKRKLGLKPAYMWDIFALDLVQRRAKLLGALEDIETSSQDPYVTVRSMYFQKQEEVDEKVKLPDDERKGEYAIEDDTWASESVS